MATVFDQAVSLERFIFEPFSDFITKIVHERPFPMDEKFTSPAGPYISMKVIEIDPVSTYAGYISDADENGLQDYYSSFYGSMRISAHGAGALSKLQAISVAFTYESLCKQTLKSKGISLLQRSSVMDTSYAINNTTTEKRAELIIQFVFVQGGKDTGDPVSTIDQVTLQPEYTNQ